MVQERLRGTTAGGGGASTKRRNCKSGGVTRLLLVMEPWPRGGTARAVERLSGCRRWSLGRETELLERRNDIAWSLSREAELQERRRGTAAAAVGASAERWNCLSGGVTDGARAAERYDGWCRWSLDGETEMLERRSDTASAGGGALAEMRNCKSGGEAQRLRAMEPRPRDGTA